MIEININDGEKIVFDDNGTVRTNSANIVDSVNSDINGKKINIEVEG